MSTTSTTTPNMQAAAAQAGQIRNVSDTAWLVAALRAKESARPDRIINDPYAGLLTEDRGAAMVAAMTGSYDLSWFMAVRTAVMDELLLDRIKSAQIDVVVNLAAGLDTRPYRLALPQTMTWFDVDMAPVIAFKTERLQKIKPNCQLKYVAADLSEAGERARVMSQIGAAGKRVLVITEGLLLYLTEDNVVELAAELRAAPTVHTWMMDLYFGRNWSKDASAWGDYMARSNAPIRFAPSEGAGFFARRGWKVTEERSFLAEAARLGRTPPAVSSSDQNLGAMSNFGADFQRLWDDSAIYLLTNVREHNA